MILFGEVKGTCLFPSVLCLYISQGFLFKYIFMNSRPCNNTTVSCFFKISMMLCVFSLLLTWKQIRSIPLDANPVTFWPYGPKAHTSLHPLWHTDSDPHTRMMVFPFFLSSPLYKNESKPFRPYGARAVSEDEEEQSADSSPITEQVKRSWPSCCSMFGSERKLSLYPLHVVVDVAVTWTGVIGHMLFLLSRRFAWDESSQNEQKIVFLMNG